MASAGREKGPRRHNLHLQAWLRTKSNALMNHADVHKWIKRKLGAPVRGAIPPDSGEEANVITCSRLISHCCSST
jgi:hypothetical protein